MPLGAAAGTIPEHARKRTGTMAEADGEHPGDGEWLSVAAAARQLGISRKAVMLRIAQGSLEWRPEADHGRPIRIPSWANPIDIPGELARMQIEITELRARIKHLESEAVAARKVEAELRSALAWHRPFWWRWW